MSTNKSTAELIITADERLKPCPFCGGKEPRVQKEPCDRTPVPYWHTAYCTDCDAGTQIYQSHNEAVEAWNNRPAEQAQADRLAEQEAEIKLYVGLLSEAAHTLAVCRGSDNALVIQIQKALQPTTEGKDGN